ncbi:MAG: PEP-CTERM sorting domain-containing protein, partial [Tepidisphaeraceae bacterium]
TNPKPVVQATAQYPEPATLGVLALSAVLLMRRRSEGRL